jgi:AcrR family transcriptional regulator
MVDTRDRILLTAFRHFFTKGYKEVTMSDLVKATGLSKGAFYHYFSSKEELYDLTMEKHLISYLQSFKTEYDNSLTLRENIKKLFGRFAGLLSGIKEIITDYPMSLSDYMMFLQEALKNNEFREKFNQYNLSFFTSLTDWIENAKSRGEIRPDLDTAIFAKHLGALMKGVSILYTYGQGMEPLPDTFNQIIDQLFKLTEDNAHERIQKSIQDREN